MYALGIAVQRSVICASLRIIQKQEQGWRREWDSNPRWTCTHGGFQDRCLKPLGHLSEPDLSGGEGLSARRQRRKKSSENGYSALLIKLKKP
jgi:hypothetical protein